MLIQCWPLPVLRYLSRFVSFQCFSTQFSSTTSFFVDEISLIVLSPHIVNPVPQSLTIAFIFFQSIVRLTWSHGLTTVICPQAAHAYTFYPLQYLSYSFLPILNHSRLSFQRATTSPNCWSLLLSISNTENSWEICCQMKRSAVSQRATNMKHCKRSVCVPTDQQQCQQLSYSHKGRKRKGTQLKSLHLSRL